MKLKTTTWKVTMADLEAFKAKLEAMLAAYHGTHYPKLTVPTIDIEVGSKFARIVRVDYGRSAYGFIDMTNGDLLKTDGWKKPAKHPRGNIFAANPLGGCTPYGMEYLR